MTYDAHANLASGLVTVAPVTPTGGLSVTVAPDSGVSLPATPFSAVLAPVGLLPTHANAEIVRVTLVAGQVWTIVRAQEGTSARTVLVGDAVYVGGVTAKTLTDIESAVTAETARAAAALVPVALKTANYAANANEFVPVDATSAGVTVTLPTAPADKTRVGVKKIDASTNLVTIARGGSDVFNKVAGSTSVTLTYQNQGVQFQYESATGIWYGVAADLGLTALDSRYGRAGATLVVAASDANAKSKAAADYVCTGTADEVTVNAALAAIASSGGSVRLTEGHFYLRTPIQVLAQNVELWGTGWGTIITPESISFNPTQLIQVATSGTGNLANNAIRSLRLVYDPAVYATGHCITASSNVMRIDDVFIQGAPQDGISLSSFVVTEFAEQRITNCRIFNVGRDAVVTDANILDLNCVNVRTSGLFATRGRYGFNIAASYVNLTSCRANDFHNGWGVNLVGSFQASIVGGHFDENGAGAQAFGTGKNGQGGGGITSDSSTRMIVTGAKFNSNDSYDVYASSSSNSRIAGCLSDGNSVKGPKQTSIYIAGGNNIVIDGHTAVDMVSRAIVVASASYITVRNVIASNPNQAATNPSIRLFAVTDSTVSQCQVSNGIIEESTCDRNLIEQNPVSGGTITTVGANTVVIPFRTANNPAYPWVSEGLLGWAFDQASAASTGNIPTTQQMNLTRIEVPATITLTNLVARVETASTAPTANGNFLALYNAAGTLIAQTGDCSGAAFTVSTTSGSAIVTGTSFTAGMVGVTYAIAGVAGTYTVASFQGSTQVTMTVNVPTTVAGAAMTANASNNWTSTGTKVVPVQTPITIAGGPGVYVRLGILAAAGTTVAGFQRSPSNDSNGGQTTPGPNLRACRPSATFSQPPASITLGTLVAAFHYWGGLS